MTLIDPTGRLRATRPPVRRHPLARRAAATCAAVARMARRRAALVCAAAFGAALGLPTALAAPTEPTSPSSAPAADTRRPDPADPRAAVPPMHYRSALPAPPPAAVAPRPWAAANDTVRQVGGWRAYLREAQQPRPADGAASGAVR